MSTSEAGSAGRLTGQRSSGQPNPAVDGDRRRALQLLSRPRTIAVLGASADPHKAGGRPLHYLRMLGYQGEVYPVNPRREEVQGYRCFPSLTAVPGGANLCVVALPSDEVEEALLGCGQRGVGAVVVFASGYAETGPEGADRQRQLAEIARAYSMALVGPNCLGYVNVGEGVTAAFTTALDRGKPLLSGNLALISQSGAIGAFLVGLAEDEHLGICHFLTTGNEADVTAIEFADYLLDDPQVGVFALYLEGVDGPEFARFAGRAAAVKKPVVAVKVGSSVKGAAASASHTGKMAGSDDVYDAVFDELAVTRAGSIGDLFDFAKALGQPRRGHGGVGVVSISGGAAVLMADWCERLGLNLAEFTPETRAAISEALPWFGGSANPVDTTGRALWDVGMLKAALLAAVRDPGVGIVLCHIGLAPDSAERVAGEIVEVAHQTTKPVFVCWIEEASPVAHDRLRAAAVPVFDDPVRMVRATHALESYERRRTALELRRKRALSKVVMTEEASAHPFPSGEVVTEFAAKQWLAREGFAVPDGAMASSAREAHEAAHRLGYPVCLKLVSSQVLHRSDIGAVRVNLQTKSDVVAAFDDVRAIALDRLGPDLDVAMLVERQVGDGVELIVSGFRDRVFGPSVLLAPGGIYTELLDDKIIRLAPLDEQDAEAMLGTLRIWPILNGARGTPTCDVKAAARAVADFSRRVATMPEDVDAIEINPLRVLEKGAGVVALDALILRRPAERPGARGKGGREP